MPLLAKLTDELYRIDQALDTTIFQRQRQAIDALILDRKAQKREQHRYDLQSVYEVGDERTSIIQSGTDLRDLIVPPADPRLQSPSPSYDSVLSYMDNQMIQSWIKRHSFYPPLTMPGDPDLDLRLNKRQIQALALALSSRISLIQGVSILTAIDIFVLRV